MQDVAVSELTSHLPELLQRVAIGEEFTITEDGRPIARLLPTPSSRVQADVREAVEKMTTFRKGRSLGGLSIRGMIEEGLRPISPALMASLTTMQPILSWRFGLAFP